MSYTDNELYRRFVPNCVAQVPSAVVSMSTNFYTVAPPNPAAIRHQLRYDGGLFHQPSALCEVPGGIFL